MAKNKEKIVRVAFVDGSIMLFGNSYKPWDMQLDEYLFLLKRDNELMMVKEVEVSDSPWVHFGGLKWCSAKNFQQQLNREGCQSDEPDNENPRLYRDMVFYYDLKTSDKVKKMVKNYLANIY